MTPLLCAQLIDVLTTGEEVCWAELPPRMTGGISPSQLHLTMLANCFRAPMSDRLRLISEVQPDLRPPRARPNPTAAAGGPIFGDLYGAPPQKN